MSLTDENKKEYLTKVEEGAVIRRDLATILGPRLGGLNKMFSMYFGSGIFKFLNNMKYYENVRYPNPETSPFKHEIVLNNFGNMFTYFDFIGKSKLYNDYLSATFGIKVVETNEGSIKDKILSRLGFQKASHPAKFAQMWEDEFHEKAPMSDPAKMFEMLISAGQTAQTDICTTADKVSVELATEVKDGYEVEPGHFMRAVHLQLKSIMKGDEAVSAVIEKTEEARMKADEAIEPILERIG